MLGHTFQHLPGVGPKLEAALWQAGVRHWDDFPPQGPSRLGPSRTALARQGLAESDRALRAEDADWFAARLGSAQTWRLFPHFLPDAGYLDIETDGLRDPQVTTVALYHRGTVRTYVWGQSLDQLQADLDAVKVLVTYNGRCFDVPVLENVLGLSLPRAHVDLRFVLGAMGVRGGLKACEKRFGLDRGDLNGVDGYGAVLLWKHYENTGDPRALETLLAYNVADVIGLEVLLVHAVNALLAETPFAAELTLRTPRPADNPFQPHADMVAVARGGGDRFFR
ncbi:ribonuclease H-like domain-containing protein [Fundidesulfovibrio butyratiphilus]